LLNAKTFSAVYNIMFFVEEWHVTKSQFLAKIDVAMGGRAAEEIVFGKDKVLILPQ
jgi:ATP-dependent Zn protease